MCPAALRFVEPMGCATVTAIAEKRRTLLRSVEIVSRS
jgi:hypothetical protein